jgi:hypothetical protein
MSVCYFDVAGDFRTVSSCAFNKAGRLQPREPAVPLTIYATFISKMLQNHMLKYQEVACNENLRNLKL